MAATYPAYLEWPDLRRAILAGGGIGPSPDWPRDYYPADLYRARGKAPDLVAAETHPWASQWGNGDDSLMFCHLNAAHAEWERWQQERPTRAARLVDVYQLAREHGLALRTVWNVARDAHLQAHRGPIPRRTYFTARAFAEALAAPPRAPRRKRVGMVEGLAA
jgi:hypothetical protein